MQGKETPQPHELMTPAGIERIQQQAVQSLETGNLSDALVHAQTVETLALQMLNPRIHLEMIGTTREDFLALATHGATQKARVLDRYFRETHQESFARQSEREAQKAVGYAEQSGNGVALAIAYEFMGGIYSSHNNFIEARTSYEKAIASPLPQQPSQWIAYKEKLQARLHTVKYLLGTPQEKQMAIKAMEQSIRNLRGYLTADDVDKYAIKVWLTGAEMDLADKLHTDTHKANRLKAYQYFSQANEMISTDDTLILRKNDINRLREKLTASLNQEFGKAQARRDSGKITSAIRLYQEIEQEALLLGDSWLHAESRHMIGVAEHQRENYQSAEEAYLIAQERFQTMESQGRDDQEMYRLVVLGQGGVLGDLAWGARKQGQTDKAIVLLQESIQKFTIIQDIQHRGISEMRLARIYFEEGRLPEAEETMEQIIMAMEEDTQGRQPHYFLSKAYAYYAEVLIQTQKFDKALESIERSEQILTIIETAETKKFTQDREKLQQLRGQVSVSE